MKIVSSSRELKNVTSFDNTTTSTVQNVIFSGGLNTFEFLNVTGITTTNKLNVTGVATFTNAIDANGGVDIIGGLVANSAKVSDLTSGRIVLAGTGGELEDSGNLTFDGSLLTVTGALTATGTLTAGLIDGGSY